MSNITYLPEHCLLLVYHFWWSLCMSIYIYMHIMLLAWFNGLSRSFQHISTTAWVIPVKLMSTFGSFCPIDQERKGMGATVTLVTIMNRWARLKMMSYPITISIFSHLLRKITIDHVMKWGTILFHNHRGCERIFDVHFAAYSLTSRQFTHFSSAFQVWTQDIFKND